MAEKKAPLLLKDYYYNEDCAGCQVEKRKAENPNLPLLHFFFIWIITLCSSLPISSIFPFLYYMVRDFNIAKREEDVSFYAGFEGSAFMVGRTLTAVLWGMVADRYGRKPVMILSTLSVVIFNTMFGLSTNYWMALVSRLLLGAFCGTLGPMRVCSPYVYGSFFADILSVVLDGMNALAYATEVSRREHQALGVAMMTSSWGIGLVIGPAIGGYLAQPADKFPSVFSQESIFGRKHCTLARLVLKAQSRITRDIEDADTEKLQNSKEGASNSWFSLLKNWPLMSTIIVYCVFQLHDMAYIEIFSLWTVSPKSVGGLSLSTEDVGQALAVAGIGLLFCQLLLYPFLERKLGPITVSRVLSIALLSCYPFFANLRGTSLSLVVDLASAVKNVLSVSITTGLFLLQNRAVNQHQRGAANGLSLCIMSFCKALGPAAAGSLLSWAQTRQMANLLPGTHMVFFVLNVVELLGFLMTYKPFLQKPAHEYC
uniref:Major facilitator superfamily (MFS) profile domain-containing protein n=1 Tax=Chenopodium quinoa TaxID=63459 RepID=A0A803LTA8_CHEQI